MDNYKKITPAQKPTYTGIDDLNEEYEAVGQIAEEETKKANTLANTYQDGFFDSKRFLRKRTIEDAVLMSTIKFPKEMNPA